MDGDGFFGSDGTLPPGYGEGDIRDNLDRGDPARGVALPSHDAVMGVQNAAFARNAPNINGFGAATDGKVLPSRDVPGKDGKYLYRQFKDGSVLILVSPRKSEINLLVKRETHPQAWLAITNEIGTWEAYRAGRTSSYLTAASTGLTAVLQAAGAGGGGGRKFKASKAAEPPALPADIPSTSSLPGWLPWAVGGVVLVGGFLFVRSLRK